MTRRRSPPPIDTPQRTGTFQAPAGAPNRCPSGRSGPLAEAGLGARRSASCPAGGGKRGAAGAGHGVAPRRRRWRSRRRSCTGRSTPRAAARPARSAARASPRTRCAWRSWCRYRVAGPGPAGGRADRGAPHRRQGQLGGPRPQPSGAARPGLSPSPRRRAQPIFSSGAFARRSPQQPCPSPRGGPWELLGGLGCGGVWR